MLRVTRTHVLFYKEWPSNYYRAPFMLDDIKFFCSEQCFMYQKAKFFHDEATMAKILSTNDPKEAMDLGRSVTPFVSDEWKKVRFTAMYRANLEKYRQNPDVRDRILSPVYDGKHFAEASPIDNNWGIGFAQDDDRADDESQWTGMNMLGHVLDQVRETLEKEGYKRYVH